MKCPNENCDNEIDLYLFGEITFEPMVIECPKCKNKIEALWDYWGVDEYGNEYQYIYDLIIH